MDVSREELEKTLLWTIDFREQVERADGGWLPMGYAMIPDRGPLGVIEKVLREALRRLREEERSGGPST